MAQVNIRRDVDDKFYRYKMPLLQTKVEGKGNGIKTVVPNMSDVARALSRPPTYPTKFFGCELGAQTIFDEKADRYIVNGDHDATRLRELLDAFIDKFVLCGSCKNPETVINITKTEDLLLDCKACGQRTRVDMRHKLVAFILKNPPKVKKARKVTKDDAPTNGDANEENGANNVDEGAESDDELTRRIKAEAAELQAKSNLEDGGWSVDTSEEAVKARVKALEGGFKNSLTLGDDDSEEGGDDPYGALGTWIQENRVAATPTSIYKKAEELGIDKKHKTAQILVQALFTKNMVEEIPKFNPLFLKVVTSEKHQKALLGGVEWVVGIDHPQLIPFIPKILMAFYQSDVLEEETIKQWGTHVSKKYVDKDTSKKVRKASEPFLKWLEEADEDDSDEE